MNVSSLNKEDGNLIRRDQVIGVIGILIRSILFWLIQFSGSIDMDSFCQESSLYRSKLMKMWLFSDPHELINFTSIWLGNFNEPILVAHVREFAGQLYTLHGIESQNQLDH